MRCQFKFVEILPVFFFSIQTLFCFLYTNPLISPVLFQPGEMPLFGSDMSVPALLGMEYPDPMGSGLSVPVLGCQTDLVSGNITALAGTMEDPDGKGTLKNKQMPRSPDSLFNPLILNSTEINTYAFLLLCFCTSQD